MKRKLEDDVQTKMERAICDEDVEGVISLLKEGMDIASLKLEDRNNVMLLLFKHSVYKEWYERFLREDICVPTDAVFYTSDSSEVDVFSLIGRQFVEICECNNGKERNLFSSPNHHIPSFSSSFVYFASLEKVVANFRRTYS